MMGDSAYKSTIDCFIKTLKNDVCFLFLDSTWICSFIQWVGSGCANKVGGFALIMGLESCKSLKFGDFWCHFPFCKCPSSCGVIELRVRWSSEKLSNFVTAYWFETLHIDSWITTKIHFQTIEREIDGLHSMITFCLD